MDFKIEKNLEMPKKNGAKLIYPWDKLDIGDSFLIKKQGEFKVYGNLHNLAKKQGIKIAIRRDVGTGFVRVWRIA